MKWAFRLLLLIFISASLTSYSQRVASVEHFIPRELVVFADDFSTDTVGRRPSRWQWISWSKTQAALKDELFTVEQSPSSDQKYMKINTAFYEFYPKADLARFLKDSFTVSCDFQVATSLAYAHFLLTSGPPKYEKQFLFLGVNEFNVSHMGSMTEVRIHLDKPQEDSSNPSITVDYPGSFDYTAWHRLGIFYRKGALKMYIDSFLFFTEPHYELIPDNIYFGAWASEVSYSNFTIATGPLQQPLRQLLAGKPLSTHAILFDVGSATIQPGSYVYLDELASLLKVNPALKLQILGHTDNDGSPEANMTLSEKRASSVKGYLASKGIAATRLSAKGKGETQPLKGGNSEQDKATNRRVEFVPR